MSTDRDQAREELAAILWDVEPEAVDADCRRAIDAMLAHPDLVRRALGMTPYVAPRGYELVGRQAWVEPPTDQGSET